MQSRCRIQTTGPNNGLQLRDYSKSSNRSENRPLIYLKTTNAHACQGVSFVAFVIHAMLLWYFKRMLKNYWPNISKKNDL